MKSFLLLIILSLLSETKLSDGDCSPSLFKLDSNSLLTLSDDLLNATEAENQCNSLGGNLVVVKDEMINEILNNSLTKYTRDLKRIWKYYNNKVYSYSTGKIDGWEVPGEELQYIHLHENPTASSNQMIVFCKAKNSMSLKNIIKNDSCLEGNGWVSSGLSGYGGNATSSKYRKVYSIENNHVAGSGWSAKLTYRDNVDLLPEQILEIYEPVYYVYIEAQFDESSNKWTWSDGSNADFDTSGLTGCQRKALHYEENWVLTNKDCTGEAYYACQVKNLLEPFWNQTPCNGTSIDVGWKHNFVGLKDNIEELNKLTVTVKVNGQQQQQHLGPLNNSRVKIDSLLPQTSYNISVTTKLSGCIDLDIESTLSITTGDSPPDPITDAFVWSPYECVLEIPPQNGHPSSGKPTAYQITAVSEVNTTTQLFQVSAVKLNETMRMKFSISGHGFEQKVNLTITLISGNCSATSEPVQGNCISQAACNVFTTEVSDSVLTLSDDLVDVTTVKEQCLLFGGNLVIITEQTFKEALEKFMTRTYTKDLTRVWIFYDEENSRHTRYSKSSKEKTPWKSTGSQETLEFVDLSSRIFPKASKNVYFCRFNDEKWTVQNVSCSEGWTTDFILYEGSNSSWIFKEVYNYRDSNNMNPTNSSRLLSHDKLFDGYTEKQESVYVADLNVFIGARYDVESEKWLWSDGSEAHFEQPRSKTCQQKILHYGKSWEFADVDCYNYQALFACQTRLIVSASTPSCNSMFAQLEWENYLSVLAEQTGHVIKMKIETTDRNASTTIIPPYHELRATLGDLLPRTTYYVTVIAIFEGCNNFNISSTLNFTTGYGTPDPVSNPQVKQSGDSCIVTVDQDDPNANIEQYVIEAESSKSSTVQTFEASDGFTFEIPTNEFGKGNQITLTIHSTNCEGQSEAVKVEGVCSSPKPGSSPAGAIAGGVVGGLVFLVIVAAIFLYKRYFYGRTAKKSDTRTIVSQELNQPLPRCDNETTQHPQVVYNPQANSEVTVPVYQDLTYENLTSSTSSSLLAAYRSKCLNDGKMLKNEFENIVKQSKANQSAHMAAQHPSNAQRNRYKNIYPYDHARVSINNNRQSDYINAAYMPGFTDEHKFIATQGPKESTLDDFWLMTWQQGSNVIIMLTKLREVQKVKSEKYWPDFGKSEIYGTINVRMTDEKMLAGIVVRKLELTQNQTNGVVKRTVTQFHYVTWPDHGIPVATSNMFYLRKMVENIHDKAHPIIVHCSAGAGRTGTYIAMDFLFDQLDAEGKCDVIRCVSNMRENRTDMVQNWKQYALIYKLIVEHKMFPDSERTTEELHALTEADASKIMIKEFNLLSTSVPTVGAQNNDMFIKIWDEDNQSVKTMNASRIEGFLEGTDYISAQGPTSQTEGMFWIMALERHNGLIVCMERNSDHVANTAEHETIQMGKISIRVESSQDHGFATEKELSYSGAAMGKRTFLAFHDWESTAPPNESTMLDFLRKIQQLQLDNATGSTLVYCSDGCSKSGTLIALMNVVERVRTQNKVDVFRTVKDLREARPNVVDDLSNYRFIYAVLMEYISSFNPYVNYR